MKSDTEDYIGDLIVSITYGGEGLIKMKLKDVPDDDLYMAIAKCTMQMVKTIHKIKMGKPLSKNEIKLGTEDYNNLSDAEIKVHDN